MLLRRYKQELKEVKPEVLEVSEEPVVEEVPEAVEVTEEVPEAVSEEPAAEEPVKKPRSRK